MTSHDPAAVVEEPVSSIVHTHQEPDEPVSKTGLTGSDEMDTEVFQATGSSCGDDPVIRSFTPPPNSMATDTPPTAEAGSQTDSSGMGTGNETGADEDTMPLPPQTDEETMETEPQVSPLSLLLSLPPPPLSLYLCLSHTLFMN